MARPPQLLSKKSYDLEVNALMEIFNARERGQFVTYTEMEAASKLSRRDDRNVWTHVVAIVRKKLLEERGVALRCANNVGYRLMTAADQVKDQRHEKSAARKIRQGGTEKALVHPEELTPHEQAIQAAVVHQAHQAGDVLRRQSAERKGFLASHEAVNQFNRINGLKPRATITSQPPDAQNASQ